MVDFGSSSLHDALGGAAGLSNCRYDSFRYNNDVVFVIHWIYYVPNVTIQFDCDRDLLLLLLLLLLCDLVIDSSFGDVVADILLWRNSYGSGVVLIGSTVLWLLFERGGYNILAFVANNLLLLVVILFFWAKSASLLNRPLPPIPELDISEESVLIAADEMQMLINRVFSVAHEIAIDGNLKTLISVVSSLWLVSFIGSFFNFLTLIYIGVLLSLTVPFLYDKFQAQVDEKLITLHKIAGLIFRKVDIILQMIPSTKQKTQ